MAAPITSATVAAWLADAVTAAEKNEAGRAQQLVFRARDQHVAPASEAALAVAGKLHETQEWSRLAIATQLFSPLVTSPEERCRLEDWQLVAEISPHPDRIDLVKVKERCAGRSGLETSPLGPILERLYARALEPRPTIHMLLSHYPLPPAPAHG